MKASWHRSRAFWFGLAGLVMLVAAWGMCMRMTYGLAFISGPSICFVRNEYASIEFGYADLSDFATGSHTHFDSHFRIYPETDDSPVFLPAFRLEGRESGNFYLYLGFWVIALAYCIIWISCLIYWQRRKHRLMKAMVPENFPAVENGG